MGFFKKCFDKVKDFGEDCVDEVKRGVDKVEDEAKRGVDKVGEIGEDAFHTFQDVAPVALSLASTYFLGNPTIGKIAGEAIQGLDKKTVKSLAKGDLSAVTNLTSLFPTQEGLSSGTSISAFSPSGGIDPNIIKTALASLNSYSPTSNVAGSVDLTKCLNLLPNLFNV